MKRLFALLLLCACGCARRGDPRLTGTFVSDKSATLAYLESTGQFEADRLKKLGTLFGELEVTYNGRSAITVLNGTTRTQSFAIVDSGPDFVLVESSLADKATVGFDMLVTNRIEFTDDGYWVSSSMMEPPFKEKFKRKE